MPTAMIDSLVFASSGVFRVITVKILKSILCHPSLVGNMFREVYESGFVVGCLIILHNFCALFLGNLGTKNTYGI